MFSFAQSGSVTLGNMTSTRGESAAANRPARNMSCFHEGNRKLLRAAESAAPRLRSTLNMQMRQ